MGPETETGEERKKEEEKRCTWSGGVGVVTMIESFPARSEACQNAEGPWGPPGKTGLSEEGDLGLYGGGSLHEWRRRKSMNFPEKTFTDFCWYESARKQVKTKLHLSKTTLTFGLSKWESSSGLLIFFSSSHLYYSYCFTDILFLCCILLTYPICCLHWDFNCKWPCFSPALSFSLFSL